MPTRLDQITCPVLILQGTFDPLVSMQSPRYLAFVPHAQWRWLPGLNHVAMSDDPSTVSQAMLDFLDSQKALAAT
jgi:pimeloyl-ACP methyl ester carboxylesterase